MYLLYNGTNIFNPYRWTSDVIPTREFRGFSVFPFFFFLTPYENKRKRAKVLGNVRVVRGKFQVFSPTTVIIETRFITARQALSEILGKNLVNFF